LRVIGKVLSSGYSVTLGNIPALTGVLHRGMRVLDYPRGIPVAYCWIGVSQTFGLQRRRWRPRYRGASSLVNESRMHRRSQQLPAWRLFGAALGAFAIAVQLLLTAWLIGQAAAAADAPDLAVICAHQQPAPAGDDGVPVAPKSHGQCPACACPQSGKVLAPPPPLVFVAVPRLSSQAMQPAAAPRPTVLDFRAPYASRAPPRSA
jgi:hypothetical protein